MPKEIIESYVKLFRYYESLGLQSLHMVSEEQLFIKINSESNSLANLVHHIAGNMLSRWTDFLNSDGEKEWRKRDEEFEEILNTRELVISRWEEGWNCLFGALNELSDEDLTKTVYIRNQAHSAMEAVNRQLAHYAYHVGQMVYIAKSLLGENWQSLSIPKGKSDSYNKEQFSKGKRKEHFTDEFLDDETK